MHGSCCDWVAYHSRRRPDEVAVANADSPFALTWTQLEARVARLAHLLAGIGPVRRGDRAAGSPTGTPTRSTSFRCSTPAA